jgi:hypothetical protein
LSGAAMARRRAMPAPFDVASPTFGRRAVRPSRCLGSQFYGCLYLVNSARSRPRKSSIGCRPAPL